MTIIVAPLILYTTLMHHSCISLLSSFEEFAIFQQKTIDIHEYSQLVVNSVRNTTKIL